jgi:hypothetical protein
MMSAERENFLLTGKKGISNRQNKAFITHELVERRIRVQVRRGMELQKHKQLEGVVEHENVSSGLPVSV